MLLVNKGIFWIVGGLAPATGRSRALSGKLWRLSRCLMAEGAWAWGAGRNDISALIRGKRADLRTFFQGVWLFALLSGGLQGATHRLRPRLVSELC